MFKASEMSILDTYGGFEVPEEKAEIEVVEDPVKTVLNAYEIYEKIAQELKWKRLADVPEAFYFEAEKVLEGREKLEINADNAKEILKVLSQKNKDPRMQPGFFLSALQNNTSLEILVIDGMHNSTHFGYKLNKNKKLVVSRAINTSALGINSEGIIINYECVKAMGRNTVGGLQVNFGNAIYYADNSKGGLHININKTSYSFGSLNGGLHINASRQYTLRLTNVLDLNKSEYGLSKQQTKLKRRLENRLKELKVLEAVRLEPYEKIYKTVKSFNFKKFEQDITDLATELTNTGYRSLL